MSRTTALMIAITLASGSPAIGASKLPFQGDVTHESESFTASMGEITNCLQRKAEKCLGQEFDGVILRPGTVTNGYTKCHQVCVKDVETQSGEKCYIVCGDGAAGNE